MSSIACQRRDDGIAVLTLDAPGASVNTMDAAFKGELITVVERLAADRRGLRGVIVRSAKSSFFAGGNLREIISVRPDQGEAFFESLQRMKGALRRFETLGVPTVALVNGHALGGGFELALSCHRRIAVDDDRIQLGCPEATLGLLPGAGGVAKLVHLLGVEGALPYLVEGRRITPREALSLGLVDELVTSPDALMEAALVWLAGGPTALQPWDRVERHGALREPSHGPTSQALGAVGRELRKQAASLGHEEEGEELTAAEAIRLAAEQGAQSDFETALLIESRYLTRLVTGRYARNMIGTLFFQMNEMRSGAGRPHDEPRRPIDRVGLVADSASVVLLAARCADRGIACRVYPTTSEAAHDIAAALSSDEAWQQAVHPKADGRPSNAAITVVTRVEDLAGSDLVIDARAQPSSASAGLPAWLASGGSASTPGDDIIVAAMAPTIPLARLAREIVRPDRLVGIVFGELNGKATVVEIVRGERTGAAAIARAFDLVSRIGGLPIVVSDSPGRLVSRVSTSYLVEAMALLGEGVSAQTVEAAALKAGMPMGPLAALDDGAFEAIDLAHHAHDHHGHDHHGHDHHGHDHHGHEHHGHDHHGHDHHGHEHHGHDHHAHAHHGHDHHAHDHDGHDHHAHDHDGHDHHPHDHHGHEHHGHEHGHAGHDHSVAGTSGQMQLPESAIYVLEKMAHGFHRSGRRHGGGFYEYADDGSRELWTGLSAFVRKSRRTPSADEALDRLLYIQSLETLRCLQEGVITSTRDANIGSIMGWGFPERTGGAAQFVNHVGVARFVARARELAQRYGARFEPPALLLRLADEDRHL